MVDESLSPRSRTRRRRIIVSVLVLLVAPPLLFVVNGLVLAAGTTPTAGVTTAVAAPPPAVGTTVTVLAYNVAKGFVHRGGVRFASRAEARRRLDDLADVVRRERPDIVFLSEAVKECTPCATDQVIGIAEAAGLRHWVFGENYNFGVPFLRIVGGNAILSRYPIEPVDNQDLAGRRPFWVTTNNRRFLRARLSLPSGPVLLGAMHTDSFSRTNNARQAAQIVAWLGGAPAIVAGDFNADPPSPSMAAFRETHAFSGDFDGRAFTFPADDPKERIDFVLAPGSWEHLETRVVATTVSDHRPVVARFTVR